jgi:hypothetical protein
MERARAQTSFHVGSSELRVKSNFLNRFKPIPPVQSSAKKYSASALPQIKFISIAVPPPHEGRFAIVTDVGGGMRWTQGAERQSLARTSGGLGDGEIVWSWRSEAGVQVGDDASHHAGDGGNQAMVTGESTYNP